MFPNAAQALGGDAVLVGTATITAKDAELRFSLRDGASGKEVHAMDYHEKLNSAFEVHPAAEVGSGHAFYFPNLDGVSDPKCIYCPNPSYTKEARGNEFQKRHVVRGCG